MTTALARTTDLNLDDIQRTAKMLAVSGYFDVSKSDMVVAIAQMATKILAGAEMGYGPFASVQGIHLIQGKPSISANLMAAAVKNHPRYDYRVRKLSNSECEIEFFETVDGKRESLGVSRFDEADATAAGLLNKDIWKKHRKNMLFARAMSNGVRFYVPDVFAGNVVYAPEELGAEIDGEGNVIDSGVRLVDTSTGEILDRPEMSEPAQPQTPEQVIASWRNSTEMFQWAVDVGGCANTFEAKNSWKNVVAEHGNEVTDENRETIRRAFYDKQLRKAEEHQQAAALA